MISAITRQRQGSSSVASVSLPASTQLQPVEKTDKVRNKERARRKEKGLQALLREAMASGCSTAAHGATGAVLKRSILNRFNVMN